MKTADLTPGTVYGSTYTNYSSPHPMLLLSTTLHISRWRSNGLDIAPSRARAGSGGRYLATTVGVPVVQALRENDVADPDTVALVYAAAQAHMQLLLGDKETAPRDTFLPPGFEGRVRQPVIV